MTAKKDWRDIRARRITTPEQEAEVAAGAKAIILQSRLNELRERRGASQAQLAEALAVSQPNVSRIERETDIRLSTLDRYVRALGGQIEIQAVFDDATVPLAKRLTVTGYRITQSFAIRDEWPSDAGVDNLLDRLQSVAPAAGAAVRLTADALQVALTFEADDADGAIRLAKLATGVVLGGGGEVVEVRPPGG